MGDSKVASEMIFAVSLMPPFAHSFYDFEAILVLKQFLKRRGTRVHGDRLMLRITRSGFTLLELLVVITIIAILSAALFGAYALAQRPIKVGKARNTLASIEMALEQYKSDFHAYPPDDTFANGSETLWYYLCRVQKSGSTERGYLSAREYQLEDSGGTNRKFISPLGGDYEYRQLIDSDGIKRMCLVADPGLDKLLGGMIDPNKGFVTSSAQAAKDNLYSAVLPPK